MTADVLRIGDIDPQALPFLLDSYGLRTVMLDDGAQIPGSHWGAPEAGLVGDRLYLRADTPVHSALHEACHFICMDADRRRLLHTDAGGDDAEENAVCYLQILLADAVPGVGRALMLMDMDAWGYSFRLGSAAAWFEVDAEDARHWLAMRGLLPEPALATGT